MPLCFLLSALGGNQSGFFTTKMVCSRSRGIRIFLPQRARRRRISSPSLSWDSVEALKDPRAARCLPLQPPRKLCAQCPLWLRTPDQSTTKNTKVKIGPGRDRSGPRREGSWQARFKVVRAEGGNTITAQGVTPVRRLRLYGIVHESLLLDRQSCCGIDDPLVGDCFQDVG